MPSRKKRSSKSTESDAQTPIGNLSTKVPVLVDMPGLLFVEGVNRIAQGVERLGHLQALLSQHRARVASASTALTTDEAEDAWTYVVLGVGDLEPEFGATIRDFAMADVLLVAAAESYVNAIANHVLADSEFDQFDKLSPVGKWLFLPKVMRLKWKPSLSHGCLQGFASLVSRRNRVIHPKPVKIQSAAQVDQLVTSLRLDVKSAKAGATSVRSLIQQVSLAWRDSNGPYWLEPDKAREHPPCFFLLSPQTPLRFGNSRMNGEATDG